MRGALCLILLVPLVLAGCAAPASGNEPGCDVGYVLTPDDAGCLAATEWCESAAQDAAPGCTAHSADGKGWLTISATSPGAATVAVTDGAGTRLFDERIEFPEDAKMQLVGVRGNWQLAVEFEGVEGAARVVLYG